MPAFASPPAKRARSAGCRVGLYCLSFDTRIADAFRKGMADPAFMATLARLNEEPFYLDSDGYRNFVIERVAEWKKAIDAVGARSG